MKYLTLFFVFFLNACSPYKYAFLEKDTNFWCSAVVIMRPGEHGCMNAHKCFVEVLGGGMNGPKLTFLGEQKAAIILRPDTYEFYAYSTDPYLHYSDPKCTNLFAYTSAIVKVELKPYEVVNYILELGDNKTWRFIKKE